MNEVSPDPHHPFIGPLFSKKANRSVLRISYEADLKMKLLIFFNIFEQTKHNQAYKGQQTSQPLGRVKVEELSPKTNMSLAEFLHSKNR